MNLDVLDGLRNILFLRDVRWLQQRCEEGRQITDLCNPFFLELVDPDAGPRVEAVVDRMAIDAALAQVPETFRVPLVLRDVGDLDYAEIADALDVPVGTVKSRIARGRAALVELLAAGNRGPADERPTPDL